MAKGLALVNQIVSVLTGAGLACGWWLIGHGYAWSAKHLPESEHLLWWHFICPLITTIGILLLNLVSQKAIHGSGDSFWGGGGGSELAVQRGLLFGFIMVASVGVGVAGWIFAVRFQGASSYGGVSLLAGTGLIFLDGLLFKFARVHKEDEW